MVAQDGKIKRLWNLSFVNILLFDIIYQFGTYMTNTVIAVYAIGLGATYGIAGLLAGLTPGAAMATRPITGFISDLLSKKFLLVLSTVLFFLATVGCAIFDSLILIGVCRMLQGASFALRSVCVIALASKVVPEEKLGAGMGWMGLSSVLSTAIGPMLSERVGVLWGYHASFWAATAMLGVCVVLALVFRVPNSGKDEVKKESKFSVTQLKQCFHIDSFIYRPNVMFSVMAAFSGVPQAISISLVILAAEHRGIDGATLYFTFFALASLIGRPLAGRLSDMVETRKVVLPLYAIEFVGVILLIFMQNLWMIALAAFLLGIGQGSLFPVLQAESVRDVEPEALGRAVNTFYLCPDINMCLSPIIGSLLLGAFGVAVMYSFGAVAVVSGVMLYIVWLKRHPAHS